MPKSMVNFIRPKTNSTGNLTYPTKYPIILNLLIFYSLLIAETPLLPVICLTSRLYIQPYADKKPVIKNLNPHSSLATTASNDTLFKTR